MASATGFSMHVLPCCPQACPARHRRVTRARSHKATCNKSQNVNESDCNAAAACISRRVALAAAVATTSWPVLIARAADVQQLQADAYEAYANREFSAAVDKLTEILQYDPQNPRWFEMRAQVLVDGKNFSAALRDFDTALQLAPSDDPIIKARLLSGRALAYEGISEWRLALNDYNTAVELAAQGGESPDPYIVNAMGNCHNSLQNWATAREEYLVSSQLFQQAKGFRGRGGSTTQRLDGAIYSASNAALMLAQMGHEEAALKEFERVARRAPGSADTRAALAALYWRDGKVEQAEAAWQFACDNITVGCKKYQDVDWLQRVRRWPPAMVDYLQDFLQLKRSGGAAAVASQQAQAEVI